MSDPISNAETTANTAVVLDPTNHGATSNAVVMAAMAAILTNNALAASATSTTATAASKTATLLGYASSRQNMVLAGTWSFNVAAAGETPHVVSTTLGSDGQFSMLKIKVWAQDNLGVDGAALPYSNTDFSATTLTPREALSLVEQTSALDYRSYTILNEVAAGIKASPPSIVLESQIDNAFAVLKASQQ